MFETLRGKTALITGGSGFLGRHLGDFLSEAGLRIVSLSRRKPAFAAIEHLACDLTDAAAVKASMERAAAVLDGRIDFVYHLAGQASIPLAQKEPVAAFSVNTMGTIQLLDSLRWHKPGSIMVLSSAAVYGGSRLQALRETDQAQNNSPYALSKLFAEKAAISYQMHFGLPVAVVRLFNVYGPGQSTEAIVPSLMEQMQAQPSIIRLGNLDSIRDYSYVGDAVRTLVALSQNPEVHGRIVNLGSGCGHTVRELVDVMSELMHYKGAIEVDPTRIRRREADRVVADIGLLSSLVSMTPNQDLTVGLKQMLAYSGG